MIDYLFSCEAHIYHQWQAELLYASFLSSGQMGQLLGLVSRFRKVENPNWNCPTMGVQNYGKDPVEGHYSPLNKPGSITEWLQRTKSRNPLVCILDPDCLFLQPLAPDILPGEVLGTPVEYIDSPPNQRETVLSRHCPPRFHSQVQLSIIPHVLHRHVLPEIVPLWYQKTLDIREDPISRKAARWVAEMWGFAIAVAMSGQRLRLQPLASFNHDIGPINPVVHYCYRIPLKEGKTWRKTDYRPWSPPPPPETAPTLAQAEVFRQLQRQAEVNQFETRVWNMNWHA